MSVTELRALFSRADSEMRLNRSPSRGIKQKPSQVAAVNLNDARWALSSRTNLFIIASEDGTIFGWRPALGTAAETLVLAPNSVFQTA